jgi:hypothetical protein
MWGNLRGWLISAAMLVVYAAVLGWILSASARVTPTTDFIDSPAMQPLAMDGLTAPAPGVSLRDCDGASLVREAIEHFRSARGEYDDSSSPRAPRGIELLIEASGCARMDLFASAPQQAVAYGPSPALRDLRGLGEAILRRGLVAQTQGRGDEARRCLTASMSLGQRLIAERVCWAELDLGLMLVGDAAIQLARLSESEGDAAAAGRLRQLDAQRRALVESQVVPMRKVLHSVDGVAVGRHVGDIMHVAQHSPDRMWRVEAILATGRLRYFVGVGGMRGDQVAADRLVARVANDPDPLVAAAARAASELSLEQYRSLSQ